MTQKTTFNVLILGSAILAILASYADDQRIYWVLKPATTILVICLTLVFRHGMSDQAVLYRKLIIIALLFCLAGDTFLLNNDLFVFGLGSFLVAQLLFAYVFYKLSDKNARLIPLAILIALSVMYLRVLEPQLNDLLVPVIVYFSCIIFMFWQSLRVCLSRQDKWGYALAAAAFLFVISDSLIAANKFIAPFDAASALILGLYWAAIAIIANLFSGSSTRRFSKAPTR